MTYVWKIIICSFLIVTQNVFGSGVAPTLTLSNGKQIPNLGLGTWLGFSRTGERVKTKGDEVQRAVEWAIDAGYRLIDTAAIYSTEEQVGRAINNKIAEGVVSRDDLFVVTKLWNDNHAKEDVIPALRKSLGALGLDYVDLYLIHWPVSLYANETISDIDYLETWGGMVSAQQLGLTRAIGVSNFNQEQLARISSHSEVTPQVLQVEINLNLQQPSLLSYCRDHAIAVMGYTPFGSLFRHKAAADAPPPRVDDPVLVTLADKYNKTVPQINLRYLMELGVIPIPKTTTKSRVEQNIQVFDFQLSEQDRQLLRSYDQNYRTIPVTHWLASKYYPFEKH